MIVWVLGLAAWAADPVLDGIEGAEQVVVERGQRWTITVGERSLDVAPPHTEDARRELRAVVTSLLVELRMAPDPPPVVIEAPDPLALTVLASLPSRPPKPADRQARTVAQDPPVSRTAGAGDHAEWSGEPEFLMLAERQSKLKLRGVPQPPSRVPVRVWGAVVLPLRGFLAARPGVSAGLWSGRRFGLGVSGTAVWPRPTWFGLEGSMVEVGVDALAWGRVGPMRGWGGIGGLGRRYRRNGGTHETHVLPRALVGVGCGIRLGRWALEPRIGRTQDLIRTEIADERSLIAFQPGSWEISIAIGRYR